MGIMAINNNPPYYDDRIPFELFKSDVCHRVKRLGDVEFVRCAIERNDVNILLKRGWYVECLYLLAMIDYLSRINDLPSCEAYEELRHYRMPKTIYPEGVRFADRLGIKGVKEEALQKCIPEFLRHNIIEWGIRDVA